MTPRRRPACTSSVLPSSSCATRTSARPTRGAHLCRTPRRPGARQWCRRSTSARHWWHWSRERPARRWWIRDVNARRARGQSLVEVALVAPILILLAMSVWDGGSVLREQVVLQQAARDGARVAATGYGTAVLDTVVANAVIASARDLPGLSSTPGYVAISYPDPQSVHVRVTYVHSLITPVLRQVWAGGSGTINLQASATFFLPRLTPVPATLELPT